MSAAFGRSRIVRTLGPALGLAATWILFALLAGERFAALDNQRLMLLQTSVVAIAAVGATLIIASGGIDLSVGSNIALGTVVTAIGLRSGWPATFAALVGVASALLVGAVIGGLVTGRIARVAALALGVLLGAWLARRTSVWIGVGAGVALAGALAFAARRFAPRIPLSPFIVTLGLWGALRGAAKGLGDNQPVYPETDSLGWIGDLMQPGTSGMAAVAAPGVWLALATALAAAWLLRATRFGRHLFAIGSSEETARLCGVDVERTKLWAYVLGCGAAGLAALLQLSYLSMGDPTTAEGYELKVIAAVVIGGASLSGGEGSVFGTLVGALIMTAVDNGCTKLGLDNWVQEVVTGVIIVAAVALDRLRRRGTV